jgi:hypothetical protein
MKTRFFSTFGPSDDRNQFLRNFLAMLSLDPHQLGGFFHALPGILKLEVEDRQKSINRLASDMSIDISQTESLIDWTHHVVRFLEEPDSSNDTPGEWADDIIVLLRGSDLLGETETDKVRALAVEVAGQIWQIAKDFRPEYLRQLFARGTLPKFDGISWTVELRAVIENAFSDTGEQEDDLTLKDYHPSIIDLVPVASVHIETDTNDHHYYQMTERDLKVAIRSLTATLVELRALRGSATLRQGD